MTYEYLDKDGNVYSFNKPQKDRYNIEFKGKWLHRKLPKEYFKELDRNNKQLDKILGKENEAL